MAGWLRADGVPLDCPLGQGIAKAEAHSDAAGQAVYYVVSLDPSGFVIVPADDWITPIVVFSPHGVFDPSPANPLGALVGRDVPARVQAARNAQAQNGAPLEPAAPVMWSELIEWSQGTVTTGLGSISDVRVSPLIASKWSQQTECGAPLYNYYTPNNYPSGCVATAMAQLMRFYQHPTSGIGVFACTVYVNGTPQTVYTRGGDGAGGPYNWAQMPLDPDCSITTTQRQAIGALCFDAGASVRMGYSPGASGADVFSIVDKLIAVFGYSSGIKAYNEYLNIGPVLNTMINPNLDAGYPAVLGVEGPSGGHAVIADGYGYNNATLYHHLNMGWAGSYDAWYNLPIIEAGYYFDVVDVALYNIYASGTGEIISGRVTDAGGNPLSGATVTATRSGGVVYTDTTDARGVYAIAKVPAASTYTLSAAKTGYQFTAQVVTTGTSQHWGTNCGNKWGIDFAATNGMPPQASDASVSTTANLPLTIALSATDDGAPNPPGGLTYIIKTLPAHGGLSVPGGGGISTVPFSLPDEANQVVYTPAANYAGPDSFAFTASDGGSPPDGGESNTAHISITVNACGPVGIGTGTTYWELPMATYFHDARTQVIYLASEIGRAGNITSLALNLLSLPGQTMNSWTIRMKHTNLSYCADPAFENSGWTMVYQTNEPVGTIGWRTFTFTTPFAYDGISNLMVDFSFNNDSYTDYYAVCAASTPGGFRSVYLETDSWYGDPLNWPTGAPAAWVSDNVPDVRLNLCAIQNAPTAPSNLSYTGRSATSITWSWADASNNEDGFRGHDAADALKWTAAVNVTSREETGLSPNTQYTRHVHAFNASGESSASNAAGVYTLAAAPGATCDRQTRCPTYVVNTVFTFTTSVPFGNGGVGHYHYVWDRNPTCSFTGSESTWSTSALALAASQTGSWYLHLMSHNAEHAPSGSISVGPYTVAIIGGYAPGDFDGDCDVDELDLDHLIDCGSRPGIAQNDPDCSDARLDTDNDVDSDDFARFQRCWTGDGGTADPTCGD